MRKKDARSSIKHSRHLFFFNVNRNMSQYTLANVGKLTINDNVLSIGEDMPFVLNDDLSGYLEKIDEFLDKSKTFLDKTTGGEISGDVSILSGNFI